MSYQNYVLAAYAVFVAAMLWDWLSPKLQLRRELRAANLRARRATNAPHTPQGRHPRDTSAASERRSRPEGRARKRESGGDPAS